MMSFLMASASFSGFSGGTRSPFFPSMTISGIPPVRVAMTGRPESMASRFTRPKASLIEGNTNMSADFINCGICEWRPINSTWSWRLRFWMSFSRTSRWWPAPAMMNRRFLCFSGSVSRSFWIACR